MTKTTIVATSMNRSGEKRAPIRHACKTHRRSTSRAPPRRVAISSAERHPAVSPFHQPSATPPCRYSVDRAPPQALFHQPSATPPPFHQPSATLPRRCSISRTQPRQVAVPSSERHPAPPCATLRLTTQWPTVAMPRPPLRPPTRLPKPTSI